MPILVVCPRCGANLNAPDSGAGKKVRCPKPNCGSLVPVPAFVEAEPVEEVEDELDEQPRSKRRRNDDDDDRSRSRKRRRDDDDGDDDRPRRKQQRKKSGMGTGLVVAIVIGSILLLGGIGYGVYALVGGGPKTPAPAGWKEYSYKDSGFKAYFPAEPKVLGDIKFNGGGGNAFGGDGFPNMGGAGDFMPESTISYTSADYSKKTAIINVQAMRFRSKVPSIVRESLDAGTRGAGQNVSKQFGFEVNSVRWLGEKAVEMSSSVSVSRMVVVDNAMYTVTITGPNGGRAKPEEEKGFFDNFQLLK
jgi:hypothetical protein